MHFTVCGWGGGDSALDNTLAKRARGTEFESRRADMLCRLLLAPCIAGDSALDNTLA